MAALENRILKVLPDASSTLVDFDQWEEEIASEVARSLNQPPERIRKYIKELHVSGAIIRDGSKFKRRNIQGSFSRTARRPRRPMRSRNRH